MRLKCGRNVLLSLALLLFVQCAHDTSDKCRRSGIFLCGEFNHWHPDSTWEFERRGDGLYVLYEREVYVDMIIDMRRAQEYDYDLWSGNAMGTPIVPGEPYRLTHSELHYIQGSYAVTHCDSIVLHIVNPDSASLTLHTSKEPELPKSPNLEEFTATQGGLSPVSGDVRVLGLGNSLLGYNRQDTLFNRLAQSLGVQASFMTHWHNGYSLQRLWDEGPCFDKEGGMSARALVASYPWTHIVLQEQSLAPLYQSCAYVDIVKRWAEYIRQWCPNPDVQVILVVNWPLAMLWGDYSWACGVMSASARIAALRNGAVVCPVGDAYQGVFVESGREAVNTLYVDDRHPTLEASYLAACMELSLVTGISTSEMNWHPSVVDAETARQLREVAERTLPKSDNNQPIKTLNNSRRIVPLSGVDVDWAIVDR